MSVVYLSHLACAPLGDYLRSRGHTLRLIKEDNRFGPGVGSHADLRLCVVNGKALFFEGEPLPRYPDNAAMCALVMEGFLIHRLDITSPVILNRCARLGYRTVNVRQGYTRCSCVPVDGKSLITSDPGIFAALSGIPELSVLKIREGGVSLPGYPSGFLGGASGRVGGEVLFNGDLSAHPDLPAIRDFVEKRGARLRYFPGFALCDIGAIIETEE